MPPKSVRSGRGARQALAGLLLPLLLAGCFGQSLPSQSNPSCSWSTAPPADADTLCRATVRTLESLVHAAEIGDEAAIRRLAIGPAVAGHILAYSRRARAQGATNLHVVPSVTLGRVSGTGQLGARFYLAGSVPGGHLDDPQMLYLRVQHGVPLVVADQPGQEL